MYNLKPPAVFVHKRVYRNTNAVTRLERMLKALGNPPIEDVEAADTATVLDRVGIGEDCPVSSPNLFCGLLKPQGDPVLVFNTFVWDERERASVTEKFRYGSANRLARLMAGQGEDFLFSRRELVDPNRRFVCQGGWGLHSLIGCVHRCAYCREAFVMNIMLDVEDFADRIRIMLERRPEQKVFRYDMYSDQICFEPEYGASRILAAVFARTRDQYLLFYTKSNNVDHLLTLPNRAHCIFYCTLGTDGACREFEPGAPSLDERIEGLRRCQEAGYVVRVGFFPIIPIREWREEATAAIEKLFASVQPDTVRLWVLSLMSFENLEGALGLSRLDPHLVELARKADPVVLGQWNWPFPNEARAQVYSHYIDELTRVSPATPVSLCSENQAVWDLLADKLRMRPDRMFCCCGGTSLPKQISG